MRNEECVMRNWIFYIILATMLFHTVAFADEIENLENQQSKYDAAAEEARQVVDAIQAKINSVSEIKRALDEDADLAVADYEQKQATKLNFLRLKRSTLQSTADLKSVFVTFILTGKFPTLT